jgi:hypothetical protein
MAEKSGFFNAREAEDGTYDREYDAEQFAEYFANFISNGVYANPANQLKVVFDDSPSKPFVVIVRKGKAYIDGYWYELTEDMEITIPANTKAYIVKDVIRCTLDKAERKVSIVLEEDVTSDHPTNNNNRHDLILSTIIVQPNASKLNAEDITDKRPDKAYCGFVTGVIDQIDTTELFQQYDETFKTWFNEMEGQLSTDAAGKLQTQIGLLSNLKTVVKDSIVNAINSLYDSIIGKTLKTLEEVSSNTEQGYYVDALVVDELNKKTDACEYPLSSFPFQTFYDIQTFSCYKIGRIVLLNASMVLKAGTTFFADNLYNLTSGSIPEELRPKSLVNIDMWGCNSSYGKTIKCSAFVTDDGNIKFSTPTAHNYYRINAIWVCK